MPSAVIFDVDGTLVDSVDAHAQAWVEAFAAYRRIVAFDVVRSQIGKGGDQLLPVFLSEQECDALGDAIEAKRRDIFGHRFLGSVQAFRDVRPLFERLRADGTPIALASSGRSEELRHYETLARITDLVDVRTTSDDAERSKPHPDIFAAALDRLGGPDPAGVVVVGDSPYDAIAAGKLGLRTVGVRGGGFPDADLVGAGCIALFDGPADLLARFDESPLARG